MDPVAVKIIIDRMENNVDKIEDGLTAGDSISIFEAMRKLELDMNSMRRVLRDEKCR